ncbi:MAG TPA: ABC transporter permease subunit [candidate division Zixibacteria bacterium]|nr:ABC transporter permease subunit [candidate division Zixibacteria bacterium]
MLATLIQKELKAIILSPKFPATFAVCSLLILLSTFMGIMEYRNDMAQYETARELTQQELRSTTSWGHIKTKVYRIPEVMQIFVSGVNYDIGRWSAIDDDQGVELRHSAYSDDPVFAVFRFVDFAFVVQFVLTLFALLFTFNAVNGEREDGTLKLILSNSVPRAQYLLAKGIGAWLGLVVPIGIPILLSLLMLPLFGIPTDADTWLKIASLMGISLILFSFFIVLGVLVSTITRRSNISFLMSLVVWILAVMIIPRGGVMAAGTIIRVPREAEIKAQQDAFERQNWHDYYNSSANLWTLDKPDDGGELTDEELWALIARQDSARAEIEAEINQHEVRLREELRRRKRAQERLAFVLSRFSPVSAYQLAAMTLAETDIETKARYEDAMSDFRSAFVSYGKKKAAETGDIGGVQIALSIDDDGNQNMQISSDRNTGELDLEGIPEFQRPSTDNAAIIGEIAVDGGIIGFLTIMAFAGAFVAFLKYDVR